EGDLKGEKGQGGKGEDGQGGDQGAPSRGPSRKGAAVDAQGRALEALRQGAEGMQKQMSQGQGNGKGGYAARRRRPGEQNGNDPLGRGREGNLGREDGALRDAVGV